MKHILPIAIICLLVYAALQKQEGPAPDGPIVGKGLRVLIVEETSQRSKLPAEQRAILTSGDLQDYLNGKCALEDSGKPAWRILDKDADASNEAKFWQEALTRKRSELPWLIISNGRKGYEGKLPANTSETLELIKKYE